MDEGKCNNRHTVQVYDGAVHFGFLAFWANILGFAVYVIY